MIDARISTGLPGHPKTRKLVRKLGPGGGWSLVCLFLWVAANRSDGDLSGMSDEDVELAAEWGGEEGALVAALVAVRFLDGAPEAYSIHDWVEHNPWAAGAEMRSVKARWNAAKRHHGEAEADRLVPNYRAASNATSTHVVPTSNAPSPSPSPSPSDKPLPATAAPACPHDQIIAAYHELLPANPRIKTWAGTARETNLRARWREDSKRQSLDYWRRLFAHVAASPFLTGRVQAQGRPFFAGLDWLVKPDNFAKVIEGRYHDRGNEQ